MNRPDPQALATGRATTTTPSSPPRAADSDAAEWLNAHCYCVALDNTALEQQLAETGPITERMFAEHPVFVAPSDIADMRRCIEAVEAVTALPGYRANVLAQAPPIARHDPGPHGIFSGYDFHLSPTGPQLIEVNTNAGGALLALATTRAQRGECNPCEELIRPAAPLADFEASVLVSLRAEWIAAGMTRPLRHIAVVDESPETQYLHPEFLLFADLVERAGISCTVIDPIDLGFDGERLTANGRRVDLVYNRSTDFYLEHHHTTALREAYLANKAVLTPHPHAHALYARKSNLVLLSDAAFLHEIGVAAEHRDVLLAHVPATLRVDTANADALWSARKQYYFKPVTGFGSRATYAGRKLTRKVWRDIVSGDYIAQRVVDPSRRGRAHGNGNESLKLDVRHYTYAGKTELVAARLYRGQTTNFRTDGGGFAPVLVVPPLTPRDSNHRPY